MHPSGGGGAPSGQLYLAQMHSQTQINRKMRMEQDRQMLEEAMKRVAGEVEKKVTSIEQSTQSINSKLLTIKYRIARQAIKDEARQERRNSIHKLEMEKNLNIRPQRSRSVSLGGAAQQIKVLKVIKDALFDKELQNVREFHQGDFEIKVPTKEYSYNDMNREILSSPQNLPFQPPFERQTRQNISMEKSQEFNNAARNQ
jgi:hypothetical protein